MPRRIPPPKPKPIPTLTQLVEGAAAHLQAAGIYRAPAEDWLRPVRIREIGGRMTAEEMQADARTCIERAVEVHGWVCHWEGENLVLELQGGCPITRASSTTNSLE